MSQQYPFVAVLGCDPAERDGLSPMGLALLLSAVDPQIGGVLVRGQKGTAKSTAVRALADVLPGVRVREGDRFSTDPDAAETSPDGPFAADVPVVERHVRLVELPVGATEDRVLGSIHLEKALTHGAVEFEPGLLARAHRGLLYVDEVNLLHDHLVDLVLDAAATGNVSVERDGVSLGHTARFVLVGTMNPEEGELRPQLLDRFGLTVEVAAPTEPELRVTVVRRRLAYDADPAGFVASWAATQKALTERVAAARDRVSAVHVSHAAMLKIAEVCAAFEVEGLRADVVTTRAAAAHAAWEGRTQVTLADIRAAALLSLPHRRRRNPFDAPGLDEDLLDRVLGEEEPEPDPDPTPDPPHGPDDDDEQGTSDQFGDGDSHAPESDSQPAATEPDSSEADSAAEDYPAPPQPGADPAGGPSQPLSTERSGEAYRTRTFRVEGVGSGVPGRRSRSRADSGRRVGAGAANGGSLHLVETIRAAAERTAARGTPRRGRVVLAPSDLRTAQREGMEANLLVFCVDASGSMAARRRMIEVKTAILSLLTDAYRRRDRVALITFRGSSAEVVLPPTGSVEVAVALLDELPAGGRTPIAEGILEAALLIRRERVRDPQVRPLLMVLSDGRATAGPDAVDRSRRAAEHVASMGVRSVVLDSEAGPLRLGLARDLAVRLGAEHVVMGDLDAQGLHAAAKDRVA